MIITRFPPSPTGFLHIGGLKTALFNYLFAKKKGGKFLLRIEDTDRERYVEGGVENILNSLAWAGISPEEGVVMGDNHHVDQIGEHGPYVQSERLDIYKEHIQKLIDNGHAYHCFCTKTRLDEVRKDQQKNKKPPMYDGYCRDLPADEVRMQLEETDVSHVVRLRVPQEGKTEFIDMIRDSVSFENKLIDDQVLLKSDGFPTYHLANVVDDHLMKVTHVIRGEEWLPSTPKHILLYKFFNWDIPTFVHLPLLVNEKKQKLSKRHGDVSVEDFKEKGYLPEALINFVAFLGWNPGDEREIFTLEQLAEEFDMTKMQKSAAVFNREKLDWYNKQYIMNMSPEELVKKTMPFFLNASIEVSPISNLESVVGLEQGRASTLVELVEGVAFVFAEKLSFEPELLVWKKSTAEDAKEKLGLLVNFLETIGGSSSASTSAKAMADKKATADKGEWSTKTLEEKIMPWIKENGFGNGDVLWPMRVALSGKKNSPGPFEIAEVLGKEKTIKRIEQAIKKLS